MKGLSSEELKVGLPIEGPIEAADRIDNCLEFFLKDETKIMSDYVIGGLTHEELICTLLVAKNNLNPWDCMHCNKRMLRDDPVHLSVWSEARCCSQECVNLVDKNNN